MSQRTPILGTQADVCDVCETAIADVAEPVTKDYLGTIMTFCSDKCLQAFYEDPEQYTTDAEEDAE